MPQELAPRLSHVGLYVSDVPKMIDFYTKVLGFVVSDGAPDGRITFLSRNPSDHHQVVRPISHGNAWSVYFQDPEGNQIEMFCDTPWYVPQPCGFKIDLDQSEDDVYRATEAYCREQPGFKPMEEWRAEIGKKIAAQLEA